MRTLRLAQAAAQAEGIRLRRVARRAAIRGVLLVTAGGFAGLAVCLAHLWLWLLLQPVHGAVATAGVLTVGDLVIAALLVLLALRSRPDPVELEARLVSHNAWASIQRSLDFWALVIPLVRIFTAVRKDGPRAPP